ncbi:DUF4153 domain-containing protein [Rhodococcus sp. NPDC058505]|uniref:DUF4153 domain-containing protein n=1 Tax=Rhodococcus sp. NPDC058505 TaxID=3346531 RepID=UPI00364882AC
MTTPALASAPARRRAASRAWRPDRTSVAPAAAVAGAAGAGVVAAATLGAPSIAYPITGLAVAATALAAVRPRPTRTHLLAATVAVLLLAVATVRDNGILVAACVVAAWTVASVALLDVRTWTGVALAPTAAARALPRVGGWVRRGRARRRAAPGGGTRYGRVAAVAALTALLVALFGALFAGADPEFGRLLSGAVPTVRVDAPVGRILLGLLIAGATLAVTYLRRRPPRLDALAPAAGRPVPRWEWAVPLAALDVLFGVFVAVQARVLFGGDGHVRGTADLTYANYARQGFWQLCAVSVLTLIVIAVAVRRIDRRAARDRMLARLLLGALCLLSLVVVASALHRMSLYQSAFGFTRLRLGVSVVELWLGGVFLLLLLAGIRMRGGRLPRLVLGSGVAALLAFAALNPDGYIAERNVDRYQRTGAIDIGYLRGLSTDAVPALDRLPEPVRSCALIGTSVPADAWYQVNAARSAARQILRERPVDLNVVCAGPDATW